MTLKKLSDSRSIVKHSAWCISVNQRRILKAAVRIKELRKCITIYLLSVISRKEHGLAPIYPYKILKASAEDTVVYHKDAVSIFSQRSTCCLKT